MKKALLLLLLVNAGFLAYTVYAPDGTTPVKLSPEVNADQVRRLEGITPAPAPAASTPAQASSPEEASAVAVSAPRPTVVPTPAVAVAQAAGAQCLRWTVPSAEQAEVARSRLATLNIRNQVLQAAKDAKVWVYIPPLTDLDSARKKADELESLGVDDYFVVNDQGRWQNTVSLGVYSTREAAERRLASLQALGVKSAVVREREDTLRPATFALSAVTTEQRNQLERSNKQLRGGVLREVKCGA
ncbi:SPOR domain-containing protein [Chitinibacteraceae bacterium HSL-7]